MPRWGNKGTHPKMEVIAPPGFTGGVKSYWEKL